MAAEGCFLNFNYAQHLWKAHLGPVGAGDSHVISEKSASCITGMSVEVLFANL